MRPLRILTWHVHGSYLWYLAHAPHEFHVPVTESRAEEGYFGRTPSYPWPANVREVPAADVRRGDYDLILFQSRRNYEEDQHGILNEEQKRLPRIFLEHDPPREHPTDAKHPVQDPNVLLVHVTAFNQLMWDAGPTPTLVVPHGVAVPPEARYRGDLARGLVVVNNIARRGRRLGFDIFQDARAEVPLDLVGMGWREADGLGEIAHQDLPFVCARYRFFFNPIRYTSLGLAVCEAMMVGMPIVGLATTEMVEAVTTGESGFLTTDVRELVPVMRALLEDHGLARRLGEGARRAALERFGIARFVRDWEAAFALATGRRLAMSRPRRVATARVANQGGAP